MTFSESVQCVASSDSLEVYINVFKHANLSLRFMHHHVSLLTIAWLSVFS